MQVPAQVDYKRAANVEHAVALLVRYGPDARVLAGGHSLICRCTGYENIVRSVLWAAKHSGEADANP